MTQVHTTKTISILTKIGWKDVRNPFELPDSAKRKYFLGQAQDQEQQQQHLLGGQLLAEEQSIHSLRTKECPKQGQVLPADEKKQDRQQYDKSTKTNSM